MAFKIRIEPSGHEYHADAGETVLESALRHGFNLPYSCRNGACATCKGRVLGGRVDHGEFEARALSDAERAAGFALFCRARPLADLVIEMQEVGAAQGIAVKTLPCRVARMERLAPDVMALHLKLPQTERLQFLAGQYLDILLRDGRRRSFSLANAPHDDALLTLHVRHVPGGHFSDQVFTRMQEKDLLRFRGPLGSFFLREESPRPLLFMAGGTGFAPIRSIIAHAFYIGLNRPMHLYWGARAVVDLYQHALAGSWVAHQPVFRYTPVLSEPRADEPWDGRRGWVHAALLADHPDLSGYDVYASGPPAMIEAAKPGFAAAGLPEAQFFYDSFEYARDPPA
jgi:CDP-4-dehydro-6-deoxyglucose reductase